MKKIDFHIKGKLKPYVNCIITGQGRSLDTCNSIPLYADGYPGIMFQKAANDFYFMPKKKKLSALFLYGQTIEPAFLDVTGPYQFVVLQLYPFASRYLLGIDPKKLNDDCFDLLEIKTANVRHSLDQLLQTDDLTQQVHIILDLMTRLIESNQLPENDKIQHAIAIILKQKGQVKIKELTDTLYITQRTFERQFLSQVGLSPKQFAKIIQFQSSLDQLSQAKFNTLTDIGFDSGFTDQSHFIRVFKRYTGQTPSYYLKHQPSA